jgi:ABC-type nitrate/sulfonate/bicarbonate transport system substrate-binding protein
VPSPSPHAATRAAAQQRRRVRAIRLGCFPNVTHAPAIVGVEKGIFERALGQDTLESTTLNAGPAAVEALPAGAVDEKTLWPDGAFVTTFLIVRAAFEGVRSRRRRPARPRRRRRATRRPS